MPKVGYKQTEAHKRKIREMRKEFKAVNEERIKDHGILPYCVECIYDCKMANAPGLTKFFCVRRKTKKEGKKNENNS